MSMIVHTVTSADKGPDAAAWITAGTALVALFLPFLINYLQVEKAKRDTAAAKAEADKARKERVHEATSATFDALDVLIVAVEAWRAHDKAKLITAAAMATGYEGVTRVISLNPILTDGAIFSCVNAGVAMDLVAKASDHAKASRWGNAQRDLEAALAPAKAANERAQNVRKSFGIGPRKKGAFPVIPDQV